MSTFKVVRRDPRDEEDARRYRLAQANRLLRFCAAERLNARDVAAGRVTVDLSPIHGQDGKIQPEEIDLREIRR